MGSVPLAPTPVDVEGLFTYARVAPGHRRAPDPLATAVPGCTPRRAWMRSGAGPQSPVGQRLVALGLLEASQVAAVEPELDVVSAGALLERLERVVFVTTSALGAQRADHVAAELAALAGAELRHASFEHLALAQGSPCDDEEHSSERALDGLEEGHEEARISSLPDDAEIPSDAAVVGLARLRAHVGLASWEIVAIDRGPWLDLPAILGLLNSMLRHVGSRTRFVVLRGDDARARVIAAPRAAIEAAAQEGILVLEDPDDALLRSFEEEEVV